MTNDKQKEIVQVLSSYKEIFPQVNLSAKGIILYSKLLADVPVQNIERAMEDIAKKKSFFPSVAEIRKEAEHYPVSVTRKDGCVVTKFADGVTFYGGE
jgi:hypothetical protein